MMNPPTSENVEQPSQSPYCLLYLRTPLIALVAGRLGMLTSFVSLQPVSSLVFRLFASSRCSHESAFEGYTIFRSPLLAAAPRLDIFVSLHRRYFPIHHADVLDTTAITSMWFHRHRP